MSENDFKIDLDKLSEIMNCIWNANLNKDGIFSKGFKRFLLQWDLPQELEHSPQESYVKDSLKASKFLFTRNFLDRLTVSSFLHRKAKESWIDPQKQWIFHPEEVVGKKADALDIYFKEYFNSALPLNRDRSLGEAYLENAKTLLYTYDGDPRNLIKYKTVQESRKTIMRLEGFGTGLSNLLMIEYLSRNIACPIDPENILPKIDRHKARIPLNTEVITLKNGLKTRGSINSSSLVDSLEKAYLQVSSRLGLPLIEIDALFWIIGSEVCTQNNYQACVESCPFYKKLCKANTPLEDKTGRYLVYDKNQRRIDGRERNGQQFFRI